ncbi:MFS transporter [Cupriavidus plantarum]|uniref:EmrB/QacA subfamily drug resistance transporter n=1 Tax=Cupriavidus plantarum TaxID=942865 RepID=A0A316EY96_9BURK|nr:MFS transporter [Cupriavidus plantarum]PWK37697.1 EmrB/QacA subfamily drug resistance transporter [Cupriavidus plantarum]
MSTSIQPFSRPAAPPDAPGRGTKAFILGTASATCSLIVLDTNVVAVSLPAIARTFQASFADVEWVVSAYMVAFASCLLPAGGLADRLGRKRMMLAGLAVFLLASVGCGLASTATFLNVARAVKGVGAAMLLTAALAIIANTFHEGAERTRAWAVWGTCMGVTTTIAPLVGGVITQWAGWRWIFLINVPVCLMLVACVRYAMTESRNPAASRIDALGSALFGVALMLGIWALIDIPAHGWASVATGSRFGAAAVLLALFVLHERATAHAMIDLSLFRQPRFVGAVLGMFGYAACAQVMMTFLPLYLQNAFEMSAVQAGVGMLPFALAMIGGPYLGARLSSRFHGSSSVLVAGLMLIGAGNLLVAAVATHAHYGLVAVGMIVTGLGAGVMNGDTQKAIMACVPVHRTGMASGISTTTRFSAIVTAVGVLGAVLASRTERAFEAALPAGFAWRDALGADFLARVLAGDIGQAIAQAIAPLDAAARASLATKASQAFASGFGAALGVAGVVALVLGATVWSLYRAGRGPAVPIVDQQR